MEKEKRKNNFRTFSKTPVGSCCFSIFTLAVITALVIPTFVVLHVLYLEWQDGQFMRIEQPNVQAAIREQCLMPDYVLSGWWNDSDNPPSYYDVEEAGAQRIDCAYKNDSWQCTCGKAD